MATVTGSSSRIEELRRRLKEAQRLAAQQDRPRAEIEAQLAEVTRAVQNAQAKLDSTLREAILQGKASDTSGIERELASLQTCRRAVETLVKEARARTDEAFRPVVQLQSMIHEEQIACEIADLNAEVNAKHAALAAARAAFDTASDAYREAQSRLAAANARRITRQYEIAALPPGIAPPEPHRHANAQDSNPWNPCTTN